MLFYVEIGVKAAGSGVCGGDKSGSDIAVVCLAEALFLSFSNF